MSQSSFDRLSGGALILGGLLATAAILVHPDTPLSARNLPVHLALYSAVMLSLLGLPAVGRRLAQRAPGLGLLGMVLFFIGLAFEDPLHAALAFTVEPTLAANPATRSLFEGPPPGLLAPLQIGAIPFILAGLLLLTIAILRSHLLPRWLAWPLSLAFALIPASLVLQALGTLMAVALYSSVAALGWALLTNPPLAEGSTEREPGRPSRPLSSQPNSVRS